MVMESAKMMGLASVMLDFTVTTVQQQPQQQPQQPQLKYLMVRNHTNVARFNANKFIV